MNKSTLVASSDSMSDGMKAGAVYALPATPLQVRLWQQQQVAGVNPAWNVAVRFRLSGPLDRDRLAQSLQLLTARHEALRTSLELRENSVIQRIAPWTALPMEWCDLLGIASELQAAEVVRLSLEHARQLLSLDSAPLFRVRVLRLSKEDHILLWNLHHAICDGWSIGLLARNLMDCYGELSSGKTPEVREALDYGDYAIWLEAQREGPEYDANRSYWKRQLRGARSAALPAAWRASSPGTNSGSTMSEIQSIVLPRSLTGHLVTMAQRHGATFFHAVLAAFGIWMRTQQSSPEVTLTIPLSGRDQTELEGVVGTFVNYVPLHFRVDSEKSYDRLLHSVRDLITDALEHAAFRFEDLLAAPVTAQAEDANGNEPFPVAFICQQDFVHPLSAAGLALSAMPSVSPGALRPLTVFLVERADGWRLSCEVDNRQVSAAAGRSMMDGFQRLLTVIAAHAEEPIALLATRADLPSGEPASDDGACDPALGVQTSVSPMDAESFRLHATEFQRRFWRLDAMNSGAAAFHIRIRLEMKGPLQVDALEQALKKLSLRHDSLRTTLEEKDGQLWQVIHPTMPMDFQFLELRISPEGQTSSHAASETILEEEGRARFSLTTGPLFRTRILRLELERHLVAITLSHSIVDGWATGLFLDQLQQLYRESVQGSAGEIEITSFPQFADYAESEHHLLVGPEKERRLAWWKEYLQGVWKPLSLPCDLRNTTTSEGDAPAAMELFPLAPTLIASARKFARERQITLFALFGALFQALVARYSGQQDILFLTPHANRTGDTEAILGPLADPICLTGHINERTTFEELLTRFSQQSVDAMENALPLNLVTPLIEMHVSDGYHPLNQIVFFYQRAFVHDMEWKDLRVHSLPDAPSVTGSEWQLGIVERSDGIFLEFLYDSTLYSRPTIQLVGTHFVRLLTRAIAEPEKALSRMEILSVEEQAAGDNALPPTQRLQMGASPSPLRENFESPTVSNLAQNPRREFTAAERDIFEIWQQLFKTDELNPESNFFDLGGHSLLLARFQIALKKKFDVQLTAADVFRQPTIASLAVWLEKAQAAAKRAGENAWMHNPRIVPIQPLGEGTPIFVISQSMIFRTLAAELGMEQPVYAVQMLPQDEAALSSMSYDDLIGFYVRLIQEVQPTGPYRIAGWCLSGWIGYGVARQLEQSGAPVEMLMVVDSWAPGYWSGQPSLRRKFMLTFYNLQRSRWISRQNSLSQAGPAAEASDRVNLRGMALVIQKLAARFRPASMTAEEMEEKRRENLLQHIAAHASKAGALKGSILLFRSEQEPAGSFLADDMGWSALVGRPAQVEVLPGDHKQIFDLPGARMMAQSVRRLLGLDPVTPVTIGKKSSVPASSPARTTTPAVEV